MLVDIKVSVDNVVNPVGDYLFWTLVNYHFPA